MPIYLLSTPDDRNFRAIVIETYGKDHAEIIEKAEKATGTLLDVADVQLWDGTKPILFPQSIDE